MQRRRGRGEERFLTFFRNDGGGAACVGRRRGEKSRFLAALGMNNAGPYAIQRGKAAGLRRLRPALQGGGGLWDGVGGSGAEPFDFPDEEDEDD
jgi:hypothetical protein